MNLLAVWLGILLGFLSGAAMGLCFHREQWLGGFDSWRRRMVRLGHISFFGIAFINLAFVVSAEHLGVAERAPSLTWWAGLLFLVGAIGMPAVCFLSAFWKPLRHLFIVPVVSLVTGASLVTYMGVAL